MGKRRWIILLELFQNITKKSRSFPLYQMTFKVAHQPAFNLLNLEIDMGLHETMVLSLI